MARLVMASGSPRRRDLLLQAGFAFEVNTADVDEMVLPGEDAVRTAIRLARLKAETIKAKVPEAVVLGADTVVAAPNGELLGKPVNDDDAVRMLELLAGATHAVVTGVCVQNDDRLEVAAALTWVTFQTLDRWKIEAYVGSGEPQGKAGAYAIQGRAARWISRIHGDYSNVVGLPLAVATEMLAMFGIIPTG